MHELTDNPVYKAEESKTSKTVYLPGLNGLRAIAALAVVVSHTTLALDKFGLKSTIFGTDNDGNPRALDLAAYGVTIFFTLSGFLITYLLLREKEIVPIKIRNFYTRRILRIWPLYYLYFIICILILWVYHIPYESSSVPYYIFLAANIPYIIGKAIPLVDHYWSLGVEEQFYLGFPNLVRCTNKQLLRISICLTIALFLLKILFWALYKKYSIGVPFFAITITRFHTMLIGAIGALLYYERKKWFANLSTSFIVQLISWIIIALLAINKFHLASVIDGDIVSIITVFIILGQITNKNRIVKLENKFCDFIGKISYGIYVFHPLVIFLYAILLGKTLRDSSINYIIVYLIVIITVVAVSYLSYNLFEKRFLHLKRKFSTISSSDTKVHH